MRKRRFLAAPVVVISVPSEISAVEKRAVKESAESAGAREVILMNEPIAAALGAGLPILEPQGSMIVDIGGGTSAVAVLSMGAVVASRSLRTAGDKMDRAIMDQVKRRHNLRIGEYAPPRCSSRCSARRSPSRKPGPWKSWGRDG